VNRAEGYKHGVKKDQHETDLKFQQAVRDEYDRNIKRSGWKRVKCYDKDRMLPIEEIHAKVWEEVKACMEGKAELKKFVV